MANRWITGALISATFGFWGCGLSGFGVDMTATKTSARVPGDVTVSVTLEDDGEPVGYLDATNFEVYENDVLLQAKDIHLRLLPRDQIASGHTILLLDLSGSPSEMELTRFSRGAALFVEKVSTTQAVTILAFDGSERAREVARFAKVDESTRREVPSLAAFLSKDTSRDLNSTLVSAIRGLKSALNEQPSEVHYGNIVTFVRGPDLAGRRTDKEVRQAIADSNYEYFSVSPDAVEFDSLSQLGKNEQFTYTSVDTLPMRFQDLGMRVRAAWQSHYLVAYCSPGRSGIRKLKLKVKYETEAGSKRSASSESEFDSTGFNGECMNEPPASGSAPIGIGRLRAEPTAPPMEGDSPAAEPEKKPKNVKEKPGAGGKSADVGPTQTAPETQTGDGESVILPPSTGKHE